MTDNKDQEAKVEFSGTKSLDAKRSSRKTKIAVIGVLVLVLLLGAVVSTTCFFVLKKPSPTRLADVNLEEGETLTYRVDQNIELQGAQVQKGMLVEVYTSVWMALAGHELKMLNLFYLTCLKLVF